jgi:hypothetical protein
LGTADGEERVEIAEGEFRSLGECRGVQPVIEARVCRT